jgi:hypothetical protein
MMRFSARLLAASALPAMALTACGGGGGASAVPSTANGAATSKENGDAVFVVKVPAKAPATASKRHTHYVTSDVTGISFDVTQAGSGHSGYVYYALSGSEPYCSSSGSGLTCQVDVTAPPGNDTFTVDLYDAANTSEPLSGYVVAVGSLQAAITAGAANTVNITTDGVPTFAVMGFATPYASAAGTYQLESEVVDPDGNVIVGSFDAPLQFTDSDTSGATQLTATSAAQNSDLSNVSITYNGATLPGGATIEMNSTDGVVAQESGNAEMAQASFEPGKRGASVSQPYLYFPTAASESENVIAVGANGGTLVSGTATTSPTIAYGNQCGGSVGTSGFGSSFTVTPLYSTVSQGTGYVYGSCYIGIVDDQGDTTPIGVIVGLPVAAATTLP